MYIKNGMNEQTLNNTVTIQGDEHVGGFVLVKRTGEGCWRAEEWSAYFVQLAMPENCVRFYPEEGRIVAELSSSDIRTLSRRAELIGQQLPEILVFGVSENLRVPEKTFELWKKGLTN